MSDNRWIHDSRTGHVIGPYSPQDAENLRRELCAQVLRNEMPMLAALGAVPTGPFYVKPFSHRVFARG
jgi:hypothetical protein